MFPVSFMVLKLILTLIPVISKISFSNSKISKSLLFDKDAFLFFCLTKFSTCLDYKLFLLIKSSKLSESLHPMRCLI